MTANIFAMPLPSLLLILSTIFSRSEAFPWAGPQPTLVNRGDQWSPRPTPVPVNPAVLFKRDSVDVAVCGWVGGKSSEVAICPPRSSCIHDTAHGYVGCCATSGPCTRGVYTSCVDYHDPDWNSKPAWQNNGVYTCPGKSECYRNAYAGGFSQWACGSPADATTIETTYRGQPKDLKLQIVFTAVTFHPKTTSATTTSSTSTAAKSSTSKSSSSSTSTSTSTANATADSANKSTISKGVLAAIIVGSLFVIAFLVGAFFFWWRKRQPRAKYMETPGSSTGGFGSGGAPDVDPGYFPEMQLVVDPPSVSEQQPFCPDDYVSPMTAGANTPDPGNRVVISPPGAFGSIEERINASQMDNYTMPEQSQFPRPIGAVSEIEHFSGAFIAAIGGLSPMTPAQARIGYMQSNQPVHHDPLPESTWLSSLKGVDGIPPPPEPLQDTASRADIAVVTSINRPRDNSIGVFAGIGKEYRGPAMRKQSIEPFPLYEAAGLQGENVREEGWVPSGLKPAKRTMSSPNRYQLVDEAPDVNGGAPVLHEPGQLRKKGER